MNYETRYAAYQQAIEGYLAGLFTADTPYKKLYESMQYSLLGAENVENYVRSLAEYCIQCAETTPGVRCTLDIPYERRSQIVLLSFDGSIAASDEDFRAAQVFAPGFSAPDANGERRARLSFHYYNNREDIDRFFAVIRASRG